MLFMLYEGLLEEASAQISAATRVGARAGARAGGTTKIEEEERERG
jgi:hypothetical protein